MHNKLFALVLITLGFTAASFSLNAQQERKAWLNFPAGEKFETQWKKVGELDKKGLPKSALDVVSEIYNKARKTGNTDQYLKAMIYKMKFRNAVEENSFENLITDLETEIKTARFPALPVMHSMLAEMYWMYYQGNSWKFQDRTNVEISESNDIKTWDLKKLADKVVSEYLLSLHSTDSLQRTPMKVFEDIIISGNKPDKLRPSLYDFLVNRSIDFFSDTRLSLPQPADHFEIKEDFYFAANKQFTDQKINSHDTLSLHFHSIRLFQQWLSFRLKDDNTEALIDADLKRLQFVFDKTSNPMKDSLYLTALQNLEKQYSAYPFSSLVSYKIARFLQSKAQDYNPLNNKTDKYKFYNKKALEICQKTMKSFPGSSGASDCESLIPLITNLVLQFESEKVNVPGEKFAIKLTCKNISNVWVRVLSFDPVKLNEIREKLYGIKLLDTLLSKGKIVWMKNFSLPDDGDYQQYSTELLVDELPAGHYVIAVSDNKEFIHDKHPVAYDFVSASDLSYIQRQKENSDYEFYVMNRKTGKPLPGIIAQVLFRLYDYNAKAYRMDKGPSYTTDRDGHFDIPALASKDKNKNFTLLFSGNNEKLYSDNWYYSNYYNERPPVSEFSTFFFTDRSIYRPGQTVYFKGIIIQRTGKSMEIAANKTTKVQLFDVNNQIITEQDLQSNEYGTFTGTFSIPQGLLNGIMQIRNESGSVSFSTEEYKRPKFVVSFLPFDGNYVLNDTIRVKGKAVSLAGSNLSDAKVSYRVIRAASAKGWWGRMYYSQDFTVAQGETMVNDKGEFTVSFKAIPDLSVPNDKNSVFNYHIDADVTDLNGETRNSGSNIGVGYLALHVGVDVPDFINKSEAADSIAIISQNLNEKTVQSAGTVNIYLLEDNQRLFRTRYWTQPDRTIYTQEEWSRLFPGNVYKNENDITSLKKLETVFYLDYDTRNAVKFVPADVGKWKAGRYLAEIISKDAFGNSVTGKKYFTVFSGADKAIPFTTTDWYKAVKIKGEPGENASFAIGSGEKNVSVLFETEHNSQIIDKQWIDVSNSQKIISVPITEDYRGNFSVHFTFISNNRVYKHDEVVTVPYTNKQLDITFESFRDKLSPGQKEEWKIKIRGKKEDKVAAELLAEVYDASLDQFRPNKWNFDIYASYYSQLNWKDNTFQSTNSMTIQENAKTYKPVPPDRYDALNWFEFHYYGDYLRGGGKGGGMKKMLAMDAVDSPKRVNDKSEGMIAKSPPPPSDIRSDEEISVDETNKLRQEQKLQEDLSQIQVRSDFSETAFFYPQMRTDNEGNVTISFTLPESLTKWRMQGFASTRDLRYGLIDKQFVTQKNLMVMPNPPRFFREGDEIFFPVKISNMSDVSLKATAQIEFFDAVTMKPVQLFSKGTDLLQSADIQPKGNSVVSWKLKIPEGLGAIDWKVSAMSGEYTDAEENVLPVLTNRMLVTESLPLWVGANENKEFEFKKLLSSGKSTTLRNERLTLEFSSNPAWYAVLALPYLTVQNNECPEAIFSRLYGNTLAQHIANSNPKIKKVFDLWRDLPDSKAMLSNLEKNQELKSLILEETPWVLNAGNESDRKKKIALLFDLNKMSSEYETALTKLSQQQASDGSFPWFPGMPGDRFITQHIISGFGHLINLKVNEINEDNRVSNMIRKAVSWLDVKVKEDYEDLKKQKDFKPEENHLSTLDIQYLYARSYFKEIEIPAVSVEAVDYYKQQAEKYWTENNKYMQGMIALALYRFSKDQVANDIIKSLKEHAIHSDEMGMYWKDNTSGYLWNQAPIETQALLIELFEEVANDLKSVEEMKMWLLKQKQTQDWRTSKATVEAVYALLLRGDEWLANDMKVSVKLGSTLVSPENNPDIKTEPGTGYYKTSWNGNDFTPEMGKISLSNPNGSIAWGALYWQYFEQLDKITSATSPLNIVKKLFIEKNTEQGKTLVAIDENTGLKVGDKVTVRIEIRSDRTMNYVHLKDMRSSGFEPVNVISRYKYQGGLGYYESTGDAATNFFISNLPKGTYVFEYPLVVSHEGNFSNGITSIQCMYAPEFGSHSEGIRVKVTK